MSNTVIKIENLSKIYRLGEVGTGTLSHDLNRWFKMNVLGKDDPYAKIGHVNDRTQKAEKGELVAALQDINLEVKQGEILGIIGKNGAGKSTLLKLLSRVTSPTTGTIKTKGRLASLLEVGTGFHPEMTGRENIFMNGTIMGMRRWEICNKLDEIVDFAGVAKYLDTPVKRYSSGMTVRLGFAIAAFLEPEILVVDEVLAVGDAEFQKKAIGKMQDVSKGDGRTVLFVSHNMQSVSNLCLTAVLLKYGEIAEYGGVNEVIEKYLSAKNNLSSIYTNNNIESESNKISFKFIESYILQHNQHRLAKVNSDSFYIVVHYRLGRRIKNLSILVRVLTQNENVIFTTQDTDYLNTQMRNEGEYISKVKIPKHFLKPGKYFIDIGAHVKGQEMIELIESAFTFEITEVHSKINKNRKGVIFPILNWELSER